ncbi:MAG: HAD-IA family hydrolase [Tannerella sp.]|nr:HAD-IA family hydrolase [Tannerella sp.]
MEVIQSFLMERQYPPFNLKAVLFDMDGVLFDSMPNHSLSWHQVMATRGFEFSIEDAYMNEGRKGPDTIRRTLLKHGLTVSDEEIKAFYQEKTESFNLLQEPGLMPGSYELLQKVVNDNIIPVLVTGSAQSSLLDRLQLAFPGIFTKEHMVTAFDVEHGKPHPESYLQALKKCSLQPWETVVVENSPLGTESAHRAGLFVIVVNTGPLPDEILWESGANILFSSMLELNESWTDVSRLFFSEKK